MNFVELKKFVLQMAYGLDHSFKIIEIAKYLTYSEKMREKFFKTFYVNTVFAFFVYVI